MERRTQASMKGIYQEVTQFWKKKLFAISTILMMLLSYRTLLLQPTVGIDDTSFKVYYVDGVSPAMGRWCLYLIHKLFPLAYNPYFVEAVGLLLLCVSVSLWCVVFYRLFEDRIPDWGYTLFSCVMLSNPIISEVVIWYLQDGTYLGYGVAALAVLMGMASFQKQTAGNKKALAKYLLMSALFLTIAMGFYESFMIVFLMGMVMVFLVIRILKRTDYNVRIRDWLFSMAAVSICALLLRTLIVNLMIAVFHLESQTQILRSRGLHEVLGWFDGSRGTEEFLYVMKDFFVKYYLNGIVYVPVLILVMAIGVLLLASLYYCIRHRDGWILAAAFGIVLLPWIMPVLEGTATYYRSSQYIPLLTAFGVLLAAWELYRRKVKGLLRGIGILAALMLLYRQGYEMNKWLYLDAMKYEDTKRTLSQVAYKIGEQCDTSKPICVIGTYETPKGLQEAAYIPEWSKKYQLLEVLVKKVDEELFEEYNTPYGYAFAETPRLSFITWGATAFYNFDRELVKFWNMHGFDFEEDWHLEHYEEARKLFENGPSWPAEGSIVEMEDHIIVNFG